MLTIAILARALIVIFERPLRLLLLSILPITPVLIAIGQRADQRDWIVLPSGAAFWLLIAFWGLSIGFGLCAWQLGVAHDFAESMAAWLAQTLRRTVVFSLATALWLIGPVLITAFLTIGIAATLLGFDINVEEHAEDWWFLTGFLVLTLPGFWLLGRLSPLPVIVANQGWAGAFALGLQVTSGRNVGLTVAFLGISVTALFLGFAIWTLAIRFNVGVVVPLTMPGFAQALLCRIVALGAQFLLWTIMLGWAGTFPALIMRQTMPAKPIDPATFD